MTVSSTEQMCMDRKIPATRKGILLIYINNIIKKCLFYYTNTNQLIEPMTQTLQVNAAFACDLIIAWCHEQVLQAITTLAMSEIPCTCNVQIATVYRL